MIAARTTSQAAEPAPDRDLVGKLLLTGIECTNARPWIGGAGMAAVYVLFVALQQVMP